MIAQAPLIGCELSLISMSDIRYVGFLDKINAKDHSITLSDVRHKGTENRSTSRPVEPVAKPYDFIVFRGCDIKDIRVTHRPRKVSDYAHEQSRQQPMTRATATSKF
jgi:protein LSM14